MKRSNLRFKAVLRYQPNYTCYRLCRLMWERGKVGDGNGYSVKLSLALRPVLLSYSVTKIEWAIELLGFRIHYQRSYGGIYG